MRILFIRSNPVDPDSRVEKQVNSLLKYGHQVEILGWDRNYKYGIKESYLDLKEGQAKIYRFGIPASFGGGVKKNLLPLIKFQIQIYRWIYKNKENFDVIHACDFDTAYSAFKVAKKFNKKFVYDIFDYYVDSFGVPSFLKGYIEKKDHQIINNADATIICTEHREKQIIGTKPNQLVIIHNTPPQIENEIEKLNLDDTKIKLVYVGILAGGRFIKEIADIVKDNPNYEFHIGGFGNLETYFREMSKQYSNVIFYGKLPYKKTLELENSCDIMTAIYDPEVPNHYYAAPNKFYESLMLGKPVIMAKDTGMDDVVKKNNIGEIIDYNSESLKMAIQNLIKRRAEWHDISERMKSLYENEYSWSEMEDRLMRLYNNL